MLDKNIELKFTGKLRESARKDSEGFVWDVAVIGEGPGLNSKRGSGGIVFRENFTRSSIQGLIPRLDGVKVKTYSLQEGVKKKHDHLPVGIDEKYSHRLTENSVGVLEQPYGLEIQDRLHACAQLRLSEHNQAKQLRDMLLWAYDNGHKEFVGLSINSRGQTSERFVESTGERFLDITDIERPKSVEVVDTPAAKGAVKAQFMRIIQSYQQEHPEEGDNIPDEHLNLPSATPEDESMNVQEENTQEEQTPVETATDEETVEDMSDTEHAEEQDISHNSEDTPQQETIQDIAEEIQGTVDISTSDESTSHSEQDPHEEPDEDQDTEVTSSEVSSDDGVEELPSDDTEGLLESHIYQPLTMFLGQKDILYRGENVREIVESIDLTGLTHLDQAALKQLRGYVKKNQINAAKQLLSDMIRQMYRLDSALEFLNEYKTLGLIKQSQSGDTIVSQETDTTVTADNTLSLTEKQNTASTESSEIRESEEVTDHDTQSDHEVSHAEGDTNIVSKEVTSKEVEQPANQIVMQESTDNVDEGDNTMTIEEKTQATQDSTAQDTQQETPAEETRVTESAATESDQDTPEEAETPEKKEDAESSGLEGQIDKLIESMSSFTKTEQSKVDKLEAELATLREQTEKKAQDETLRNDMMDVLNVFRQQQEQERMDNILRESGLLPEVVDEVKEELAGKIVSSEDMKSIIDRKKKMLMRIQESSPGMKLGYVSGVGMSNLRMGADAGDKFQVAMYRLFESDRVTMKTDIDKNPAWDDPGCRFTSLRQGYTEITGDVDVTTYMNPRYIKEGVIGHDTFEQTLSNTMNRYMVQWYDGFEQTWRRIVRVRQGIRDFKAQEINRVGGFGNLRRFEDTMAQPSPTGYKEATPPIEEAGSFKPHIWANIFTITEVMIKNDDLFVITRMLEESARSADETLMTYVFSLLVGGKTYYEGNDVELVPSAQINSDYIYNGQRKLYGADNSGTVAFGYQGLLDAIWHQKDMKKLGNDKSLRLYGKKLIIVPLELEQEALRIHPTNCDRVPGSADNDPNIIPRETEIIAVDKMYLGNDANNWYLVEDPGHWEGIQLGFVDDEQAPRIVLANNPTAGRTFTHGGLQYTVSHRYGGGIAGHEGMYASLVA